MCLNLIEILFLIAGVWLIFSGKVPQKFFKVLFGEGQYVLTPTKARLFGLVLASPFPVVIAVTIFLGVLFGENGFGFSIFFEIGYVIIIAITAIIVARKIRHPEAA